MWEALGVLTSLQRKQLHLRKGLIEAPDASLQPAQHLLGTLLTPWHYLAPGCQAWRGTPLLSNLVLRMASRGSSQAGVWGVWRVVFPCGESPEMLIWVERFELV